MKAFSVFAVLLCMLIQSCALMDADKPATWSGFIQGVEQSQRMEGMPWDHAWEISPDYSKYTSVYFAPVTVEFLDEERKRDYLKTSVLTEKLYNNAVNSLANYMREAIYTSFAEFDNHRLTIVEKDQITTQTMIVKTALTEVVFHDPTAYITSLFVPLPGSTYALDGMISPSIAFEMKVTDGESGDLLTTLADRSLPVIKPIDVRKFSLTGPLREIIETWSDELATSANQVVTKELERRRRFKLF